MLTLRLPKALEAEFLDYCERHGVSKTEAGLTERAPLPIPEDDPLVKWIGVMEDGPSTDEWLRATRGDDWNRP